MTTAPSPKELLARSLVELRTLRHKLAEAQRSRREPIAVVGIGCRFPGGCDSPDALWRFLCEGGDATGEPPEGRWSGPPPADTYTRRGAYLPRVDGFDARFFGVSERELRSLDPQHRLLLEVCWEALEHAAIAPDRLRRSRTGIFCGISTSDWAHLLGERVPLADFDGYFGPGTALSFAPGRVAYFLGLQGPSLAVDTACSSSLVAAHLACQSLRSGECDLALAAGVNLILSPAGHVVLCRARVLSPEGRCKTFDAGADGYARGEGCGVVVLKRLGDALAAGDPILAVIRGSAVNQDGPASGLTVPNPAAQEAVVLDALESAGLGPDAVDYVEAHGTGTALGDPIEVRALVAALGAGRTRERPLLLGTVKTNLGHLESAAGIAGLIKLVLSLHHGELPRHLHLRRPNPAIAWDTLPVEVVRAHRPWPAGARIAGLSSFGASGTNAHAILSALTPDLLPAPSAATTSASLSNPASHCAAATTTSAVSAATTTTSSVSAAATPATSVCARAELLVLSAASEAALRALAGRHAEALHARPDVPHADWCATATLGRARLAHSLALVADTSTELAAGLAAFAADVACDRLHAGLRPARPPRVAFVFSGQGAHRPGMSRDLRAECSAFRDALDACDALLRPQLGRSVVDLLDDPAGLDDTLTAQPALFAFGWALAAQWRAWGVEPAALFGHSLGGYLAACLAGVLRLEDAAPLVARRAALMHALPRGRMVAVSLSEAEAAAAIAGRGERLAVAAINGPAETVLSGSSDDLEPVLAELAAAGVRVHPLRVSHAFHSPLMDPALDAFEREVARVPLAAPQRPLVSDLTGRLADEAITRPAYFRRHLREPVRFADGLATLRELGCAVLLEIGPGSGLTARAARAEPTLFALPALRGGRPGRAARRDALGELAVRGVDPTWPAVHAGHARRRELPTYPFQRQHYGLPAAHEPPPGRPDPDPLLGRRLPDAPDGSVTFLAELHADDLPILRDHRVYGRIVVSGTVHATMILRAARQVLGRSFDFEALEFLAPLVLPEHGPVRVETRLVPAGDDHRFELVRRDDGEALVLSRGRLVTRRAARPAPAAIDLAAVRARCRDELAGDDFYRRFWKPDEHALGPSFRTIDRVWRRDGEALASLRAPAIDLDDHRGLGRETLLAACIGEVYGQVLMPALPDFEALLAGLDHTFLGQGMTRSEDHSNNTRATFVHAVVRHFGGDELRGDIRLLDDAGAVLVVIDDLRARRVPRSLVHYAVVRDVSTRRPDVRRTMLAGPPEQLGARAREYVRARVAALVGGPADFTDDATLQALGVDSLMALDLHEGLRRDLGVDLPLDATLHSDSLAELTARLVTALTPPASPPASPTTSPPAPRSAWLRTLAAPARPATRLIAFPHGGAGPSAFLPWRSHLPDDLAVDVIQLPGRWERLHEPPHARMAPLLAAMLAELAPLLEPPFAFFGVSMGALVAHEFTRALLRAGGPAPSHLIVAAYPAPDLPNPLLARADLLRELGSDDPARLAATLTRQGLVPDALTSPESLRLLLPALRADLELVLHHPHHPDAPLPLPITALGGVDDPIVTREQLAAWARHSARDFALRLLPGPHLFYRSHPRETLHALAQALACERTP